MSNRTTREKREVMEGLKNMAAEAMGDDSKACVQCGKWIEPGNTGTVCGACTQSMLGMGASMGASFQPLSTYAAVGPETNVGLAINGHNLHVSLFRSLQGLADDIANSMLPEEIDVLVRL